MAEKGRMTVEEAGRKGGHKGGTATSRKYGPDLYHRIGKIGGRRVRELIEQGKREEMDR